MQRIATQCNATGCSDVQCKATQCIAKHCKHVGIDFPATTLALWSEPKASRHAAKWLLQITLATRHAPGASWHVRSHLPCTNASNTNFAIFRFPSTCRLSTFDFRNFFLLVDVRYTSLMFVDIRFLPILVHIHSISNDFSLI